MAKTFYNPRFLRNLLIFFSAGLFLLIAFFQFVPQSRAGWIEPIYQVLKPPFTAGTNGDIIQKIWTGLINLVDSFVLIMLVAVAFANILRIQIDSYAVKKILPTFIMAVILANFSFLIARVVIDLGNMAISLFLAGNSQNNVTGAFDTIIKDNPPKPGTVGNASYIGTIAVYIIKQVMVDVGAVFIAILSFIFLIRNWLLYALVAVSPVAFLAMILPMTKKYFQMWWSNFTKWVFMPVVAVFWLWIAAQFMTAVTAGGSWVLAYGFAVLCFYMAITSPFKLGGAVMSQWQKFGKNAYNSLGGGYLKRRVNEEYGFQKTKVANWAASKKVVPTIQNGKFAWDSARNTQARLRTRLGGPGLVTEKQVKDANAAALKFYLDRGGLPSSIAGRYNAQLRSRYIDESKSYTDAGVDTLLDEKLIRTSDGLLAMPAFSEGKAAFKDEGTMQDSLAKLATIKKTLGKAVGSQDRKRLLTALSTRETNGNSKLGNLLGQAITPDNINDENFIHGLDTLRALDMGPYNNTFQKKRKDGTLDPGDTTYALENVGGRVRYRIRSGGTTPTTGTPVGGATGAPAGEMGGPVDLTGSQIGLDDETIGKIAAAATKTNTAGVSASLHDLQNIDVNLAGIKPEARIGIGDFMSNIARRTEANKKRLVDNNAPVLNKIAQLLGGEQNENVPIGEAQIKTSNHVMGEANKGLQLVQQNNMAGAIETARGISPEIDAQLNVSANSNPEAIKANVVKALETARGAAEQITKNAGKSFGDIRTHFNVNVEAHARHQVHIEDMVRTAATKGGDLGKLAESAATRIADSDPRVSGANNTDEIRKQIVDNLTQHFSDQMASQMTGKTQMAAGDAESLSHNLTSEATRRVGEIAG
ncbi:MAG: hypothetical protein NTW79_02400 [Candidatus Berkelbacteria bacterium]|nr:hypothetical protein [Candidatus Berkelbacteria bacterium]